MTVLQPTITRRSSFKIASLCMKTCLRDNNAAMLWRTFGPRCKEISNIVDKGNYSIQQYDKEHLSKSFLPKTIFTKWAAVSVGTIETLEVPAGLWAVFTYKGLPQNFGIFIQNILQE